MNPPQVSIEDQCRCATRELKYRKFVYPKALASGKMTQALVDRELERMTAIVATLETLRDGQPLRVTHEPKQGDLFNDEAPE